MGGFLYALARQAILVTKLGSPAVKNVGLVLFSTPDFNNR
jgi:hypothetical protein